MHIIYIYFIYNDSPKQNVQPEFFFVGPPGPPVGHRSVADEALVIFEDLGDSRSEARATHLLAEACHAGGRSESSTGH